MLPSPLLPPAPAQSWLQSERAARVAGVILLLAAALLYALTLDTGVESGELIGGDLITHQYAQVQGRPGNAPGYPLYTMGGWLWFHAGRALQGALGNPLPNPLPILSSYSTLWALLSIWLLYECMRGVTSSRQQPASRHGAAGNWPLALLLSTFYAVTFFFWYYATTTEQYTSAIAQTLAMLLLYLRWQQADRAAGAAPYGVRSRPGLLLVALALLNGIAPAHMLTVALMTPPLVIAILWQRPTLLRRWALLLAIVAAALLPLLAYLYVWQRGAAHPEWWGAGDFTSARDWFWRFVSTAQGRDELSWGLEAGRAWFGNGFPAMIWQELSLPLLLVGLVGIAWTRRATAFVLYATLALYALFCWFYRFGNWYQVALPAYPLIVVGAAAGIDALLGSAWPAPPLRRWLHGGIWAALVAAVIWRAAASLPQTDSRNRAVDFGLNSAAVMLATAPARAALFAPFEEAHALDYLISIWGLAAGRGPITVDDAEAALEAGRPLLSTWQAAPTLLAELGERLATNDANTEPAPPLTVAAVSPDWVQILPSGTGAFAPPAALPSSAVDAQLPLLEGALLLERWAVAPAPTGAPVFAAPPALDLWLEFTLPAGWPAGVALSVRPTLGGAPLPAETSGAILQRDSAAPLAGLAAHAADPTRLIETLRVPLLAPLPAGADGLTLLFYRADGAGGFETLDEVQLALPEPAN